MAETTPNDAGPATGLTGALPKHGAPVLLWAHGMAIAAISGLTVYISRGLWGWTYDDVFIIYRYARNFAAGLGMVYNPGEHYLGTSSVGYTLLLAALHVIPPGLEFLTLGSIISTAGFWTTGVLLWLLGVQARAPLAGLLAALITVANPVPVEVWGGEMALLVPLVLATILCYCRGMGLATGVLLGLAVLTRQDSLVLVALLASHYVWTRRRLPLAAGTACILVLAPWIVYSWIFFGSPLPGTLEAKIAQGQAGWPFFLSGAVQWLDARVGPGLERPLTLILIPLGALHLGIDTLRKARPVGPWLLILGWVALFSAGYTALRVAFYGWYAVPLAIGCGILVAWGLEGLVRLAMLLIGPPDGWRLRGTTDWATSPRAGRLRAVLASLLALAVLVPVGWPLATRLRAFDDNYITNHRASDLYARAGAWLAAHGGAATSAAYLEVGEIGFYSNAHIVDLLGLVTPGAAAHVPAQDYAWAIQRYQPEYYLQNTRFDGLLQQLHLQDWFTAAYTPVVQLDDHWLTDPQGYHLTIYQRRPGSQLPAPLRPVAVQRVTQQPLWVSPGARFATWPGQTFSMPAPNLDAIALLLGRPATSVTGTLVLHLRQQPADTQDLRRAEAPLRTISNNTWHTFRFVPVPDSAGHVYFLTVEVVGVPAGPPPVAIWAATDDLYAGGTRYEGARPASGDFALRISVPDSTP